MLRKKLVPKQILSSKKLAPKSTGVRRKLPAPPPEDEDEDEEEVEEEVEEEEEEAPVVKKKVKPLAKRRVVEEEDEDEDEEEEEESIPTMISRKLKDKKKAKSKGASALANAFDNVPLTNNSTVKAGKYEAIIKEMVLQPYEEGKGQKIRIKYELCDPEYTEDNELTDWRTIVAKDGEANEVGIRLFKQELARLGYEVTFDELEECFEQITDEKPGIMVKVSYREWQGNDFLQTSIDDLCDNDVVQEYKDTIGV